MPILAQEQTSTKFYSLGPHGGRERERTVGKCQGSREVVL